MGINLQSLNPNTTASRVFNDAYELAERKVDKLSEKFPDFVELGANRTLVPETPLLLSKIDAIIGGIRTQGRFIGVQQDQEERELLSVWMTEPSGSSRLQPHSVRAYRDEETRGAYSLNRRSNGSIVCRLSQEGAYIVGGEERWIGSSNASPNKAFKQLEVAYQERLRIVARRIFDMVGAVGHIMQGEDPQEVLAEL